MQRRAFLAALAAAPARSGDGAAQRLEITLERLEGSNWRAVAPGLVLDSGDRIRFRFRASFSGYLYVMNQGTSGSYTLLFPREETGRENNIRAGTEYFIPATETYFRVAGPPGHDIVYWMVTPAALGDSRPAYVPPPPPSKPARAPSTLVPRCDDTIFRARGECIDASAGPRQLGAEEKLPENLAAVPGVRPRDLVILRRQNQSVLSPAAGSDGPVVYEFRLAHR